jgi:ribosomal protein S18 acetylase RimI-like enzyme
MIRIAPLTSDAATEAAFILREYMIATQVERGNRAVVTAGLPEVLERECRLVVAVYTDPNRLFLAYDGDALAGCVGVKLSQGDAEIARLHVRPAHRGSRIATRLMKAAEHHARTLNADRLILDVLPSRAAVIDWYRRRGFRDAAPFDDAPIPMVYLEKTI